MTSQPILPLLPVETLHDIVLYLPRYTLRTLLVFQPHPLGNVASYVYFSTLSLHFGIRCNHRWYFGNQYEQTVQDLELLEWHNRRSHEILTTIIDGKAGFSCKVRRLKIYAPGSTNSDDLEPEMGLLRSALPKLRRLEVLEYHGLLLPLRRTIMNLSKMAPHLQSLCLSDCVHIGWVFDPTEVTLHSLRNLQQLSLCSGWDRHLKFLDLTASPVKKVHIVAPSRRLPHLSLAPAFICTLTHLSLTTDSIDSVSPFEIALKFGVNIRSLRIRCLLKSPNAHHFRLYADALPFITEFGIYLTVSFAYGLLWDDVDFFPAVCDFLRRKEAQLVHMEIRAPNSQSGQNRLGFDGGKVCWDMFKQRTPRLRSQNTKSQLFSKLESLSITMPAGRKNFALHYSHLIPKGVTRLSLSGEQIRQCPRLFAQSFDKKRRVMWPPCLRLICLHSVDSIHTPMDDYNLTRTIAKCIPTVRVVKIMITGCRIKSFWSVSRESNRSGTSRRLICTQWSKRQSTAMKEEMLDRHECEDTWFADY